MLNSFDDLSVQVDNCYLDVAYLLDSHNNLDRVQAVEAEVVGEVCVGVEL